MIFYLLFSGFSGLHCPLFLKQTSGSFKYHKKKYNTGKKLSAQKNNRFVEQI